MKGQCAEQGRKCDPASKRREAQNWHAMGFRKNGAKIPHPEHSTFVEAGRLSIGRSAKCMSWLEQTAFEAAGDGFSAVRGVEFYKNRGDVRLGRTLGNPQ